MSHRALPGEWHSHRPPIAEAGLAGDTVTVGGYCCTAPIRADLFTNVLPGTVPVNFPVGTLHGTSAPDISHPGRH
jgi:hypothetical protein